MSTWTNEQAASFWLLTDNQDMEAINRFISDTIPVNAKATKVKDEWIKWWDSLGWYDKNVSTAGYDEARNRYHDFIRANVVSAEQLANVNRVIETGTQTEEMEGETRRALSTGDFEITDPVSEKLGIGSWIGIGFAGAIALGITLGISKIVSNPTILFSKKP